MHLPLPHVFQETARQVRANRFRAAWQDIVEGLRRRWMWMILARQDIKMRYRGSILGPFWVTINTAVMVAAMGVIYPHLLRVSTTDYVPYLTIGMVIWSFLSGMINEACNTFIGAAQIIHQIRIPLSTHAYRVALRNFIAFAHSLVIVPVVIIAFGVPLKWDILLIVPALVLLAVNSVWVCILLGMMSARFRDIPPIVGSVLSVIFFVTPVFWHAEALGSLQWIVELNPFFAAIDVLRSPLIGQGPSPWSWALLLAVTAAGCGGTFVLFSRFRSRIVFWI